MKTLLFWLCFSLSASPSFAAYFHFMQPAHPEINSGISLGAEEAHSNVMLALITHSHSDGYFLIPGADWTPLSIGGGMTSNFKIDHASIGSSCNMLPVIQEAGKLLVDSLTPGDKYLNLKSLLTPSSSNPGDITGSLGFDLEHKLSDQNLKHWKIWFTAGAAWHF